MPCAAICRGPAGCRLHAASPFATGTRLESCDGTAAGHPIAAPRAKACCCCSRPIMVMLSMPPSRGGGSSSRAANMGPRCHGQRVRARRAPVAQDGIVTVRLKQQPNEGCGVRWAGAVTGSGQAIAHRWCAAAVQRGPARLFTERRVPRAPRLAGEKACLDAIMLGLSLARLVAGGWLACRAAGLDHREHPDERQTADGVVETLVADSCTASRMHARVAEFSTSQLRALQRRRPALAGCIRLAVLLQRCHSGASHARLLATRALARLRLDFIARFQHGRSFGDFCQ